MDERQSLRDRMRAGEPGEPIERRAWDQLAGESDKAYRIFHTYLELGADRTILAACKVCGKRSSRRAEQWSVKWRWKERASAWDTHLHRQAEVRAEDLTADLQRRHAYIAQAMAEFVEIELAATLRKSKRADENTPDRDTPLVSANELKNIAKNAVEIGRLITGQPTEHAKVTEGAPDYGQLSVEELRQLRALREKAKKK
jgi:hypothetical protein